jgi:hypothetical protein
VVSGLAGFKQVHFLVGTVTPAMYQPAWDRFWDAAEDAGVIVSYHAGGVSATGAFSPVRPAGGEGGRPPAFNMRVGNGGTMFSNCSSACSRSASWSVIRD